MPPLVLAVVVLLLVASLAGQQWHITGTARAAIRDDRKPGSDIHWMHIFKVIAALTEKPPKVPVVYLLGGSAAIDSTVSDNSWATEVRRLGGSRVRTCNFGSPIQSYAQDVIIVNHLPALPSIVLIGVNLGRYTGDVTRASAGAGSADAAAVGDSGWHGRGVKRVLSDAQKRSLVRLWLANRYPFFEKNFAGNAVRLDQLIATCLARDLHPVLLELPLNRKIVGRAFAKPRVRYRDSCRKLAKKYGIPRINFLRKVHLASSDFADLFHLVQPGQVKWQRQLSKTVVALLKRYDMGSR